MRCFRRSDMRLAAIVAALGLALAASPAHADAKTEAKKRKAAAAEHHKAGRFDKALEQLAIAYTLSPEPDLLYAIAQMHVKLGDCGMAITYYERFLSTRPPAMPADAAREAIEVCKTQPPPAVAEEAPAPPPPVTQPAPVAAPPPQQRVDEPRRWYKDPLAGGLVAAGVASAVIAVLSYRSAIGDLDAADGATTYLEHAELVDDARGKRTLAAVLAGGGLALVGAGTVRYVMVRNRKSSAVAVMPHGRGGLVTWTASW